ncbi:NGP1NT domain-containing protein [Colletotrichum graminicola]|uniref:Nucleolar GTP-binding protein 2 n=1 Tax=Colletotrichum graminicola (strain M1.001 / M2 / FGSC 10212) TaxID=645133 RepID=E3QM30_COLGM|nr:NGP1NT domain-containing protein [Colletotrichum graminicola M1.001]EFQ31918.1 NGP1NT domain-containing protein [Colletotrichum graminicola M1.001]WDK21799.1 NGP1NT domain-containing protein [Colletotrichum graminicola]
MGTGKKEASRKVRQGKTGDGMGNVKVKGENFYRSAKRVRQLNMYKDGKPQRNADGEITKAASYQSRDIPIARIEPNRKWFGNTRVISQESLTAFRSAMAEKAADPYSVLLKSNKLPMSLIKDGSDTNGLKKHQAKMTIETSSFGDTFGPKSQRKRVKMGASSIADLAGEVDKDLDSYNDRLEQAKLLSGNSGADQDGEGEEHVTMSIEPIFNKGQSKRIWNELYRVLDSSDVVIHVLDARDPLGTRCRSVEKYLREEAPHKHLIFVLNKTDLVPTSVAARWVKYFSKDKPTLAMHSSLTNPFGKGSLIELLRQYAKLHSDRKQISVGLIGYPNVGKSSIVNTLRKKKVATVAPIPGETKVWQYITLTRKIYMIDCPGIVPPSQTDTPQDLLLRGVVRVENVDNPEQYIPAVLAKVKTHHMERTYELKGWNNHMEFLEMIARKSGRLLKGGEPDLDGVAKMVLNDFMRGKIPWFTPAPVEEEGENTTEGIEGRGGRLGEMPQKRKRTAAEMAESVADTSMGPSSVGSDSDEEEEGDEFEGFDSDDDKAKGNKPVAKVSEGVDDDSDDMIPLDEISDEDSDSEDGGDGAASETSYNTSVKAISDRSASNASKKRRKT